MHLNTKNTTGGDWRDGSEVKKLAALIETHVRFPASILGGSPPPVTPALRDLTPSFGL